MLLRMGADRVVLRSAALMLACVAALLDLPKLAPSVNASDIEAASRQTSIRDCSCRVTPSRVVPVE